MSDEKRNAQSQRRGGSNKKSAGAGSNTTSSNVASSSTAGAKTGKDAGASGAASAKPAGAAASAASTPKKAEARVEEAVVISEKAAKAPDALKAAAAAGVTNTIDPSKSNPSKSNPPKSKSTTPPATATDRGAAASTTGAPASATPKSGLSAGAKTPETPKSEARKSEAPKSETPKVAAASSATATAAKATASASDGAKVEASQSDGTKSDATKGAASASGAPSGDGVGNGNGGGSAGGGSMGGGGASAAATAPQKDNSMRAGLIGGAAGALGAVLLGPILSAFLPANLALTPVSTFNAALAERDEKTAAEIWQVDERTRDLAATSETAQGSIAELLERVSVGEEAQIATNSDVATIIGRLDSMNEATVQREATRAQTLDTLRSQVGALAAAIAATPAPGATGEGAPASAPVTTRLALLEGALRRLEARVNGLSNEALPTPDLTRIDLLDTRIRALEARPIGTGGDAALGVAFAGLAQAVAGSSPFETELETLEKVAGIEAPEALGDPSALGLPSTISLANRFDDISARALQATAMAAARAEGGNWFESTFSRVSALVVVRPTGEVDGDTPDAIMSRADARLREGDVQAALTEIDALPQVALDAMGDWLNDARKRADAEAAMATLKSELLGG